MDNELEFIKNFGRHFTTTEDFIAAVDDMLKAGMVTQEAAEYVNSISGANQCAKCHMPTSNRLCLRCEVEYLREYKRKEEEDLKELVGSPIWNMCVNKSPIGALGCVINFTGGK